MRSVLVNSLFNAGKQVVAIVVAFVATPVFVHSLGDDRYGMWSLVVSITGYYSFLEFGVATAVVKYVSQYAARRQRDQAVRVYSAASLFFGVAGAVAFVASIVVAYFFDSWFDLPLQDRGVIFAVVLLMGATMAINLSFSALNAALFALQEIPALSTIETVINIVRNLVLVVLLLRGHGLLMMALVTLLVAIPRLVALRFVLAARHRYLRFRLAAWDSATLKTVLTYSLYSFLIAIAAKVMYLSSSVIIGRVVSVGEVTFYSIAASLLVYFEAVVWALLQVLIPVISEQDAVGNTSGNQRLYTLGTRYSIAVTLPVMLSLFAVGDVFIANWMGPEYGTRCDGLLKILVVGYFFTFSQFIAHAILKGVNRHRVLAFIVMAQATAGIVLGIVLAAERGVEGVALGTAIPMVVANLLLIPLYTCRVLGMDYLRFLRGTLIVPAFEVAAVYGLHRLIAPEVRTYADVIGYGLAVTALVALISWLLVIEPEEKRLAVAKARALLSRGRRDG